jgi:hypothetical protein
MKTPSQKSRIFDLLSDGQPHNTAEIMTRIYGVNHFGYCNVHGRITDIRQEGHEVKSWMDKDNRSLCWYQMTIKPVEAPNLPQNGHVSDLNPKVDIPSTPTPFPQKQAIKPERNFYDWD